MEGSLGEGRERIRVRERERCLRTAFRVMLRTKLASARGFAPASLQGEKGTE